MIQFLFWTARTANALIYRLFYIEIEIKVLVNSLFAVLAVQKHCKYVLGNTFDVVVMLFHINAPKTTLSSDLAILKASGFYFPSEDIARHRTHNIRYTPAMIASV